MAFIEEGTSFLLEALEGYIQTKAEELREEYSETDPKAIAEIITNILFYGGGAPEDLISSSVGLNMLCSDDKACHAFVENLQNEATAQYQRCFAETYIRLGGRDAFSAALQDYLPNIIKS